jgi:hypothetical protein
MDNIKKRLQADAALVRKIYLDKPFPKANVAIIELHLTNGTVIGTAATSRGGTKSPTPKPNARSEGGHFQPIVDDYLRDKDAEYKALFALAETWRLLTLKLFKESFIFIQKDNPVEVAQKLFGNLRKFLLILDYKYFETTPIPNLIGEQLP